MLPFFRKPFESFQMFANRSLITAAFQAEISGLEGSIVYLPEGKHRISATVGGKPKTVDVEINSTIAASFQSGLSKRFESNVRPFAGFDHVAGAASFIPTAFRYEEGVGLVLDVEWTEAGRRAIEGRDYSYFSPTFLLSKDGIPTGLADRGEIGSLVNDPAFVEIPRIAASHSNTEEIMIEHLIELGLVEASQDVETAMAAAKTSLATLRESASTAETVQAAAVEAAADYDKMKARMTELEEENAKLKKGMSDKASAAADHAIDEAVKAGRIAPQDEATKSFWRSSILADESSAIILASIPANPALSGQTVLAGRNEETPNISAFETVQAGFKAQLANLNTK